MNLKGLQSNAVLVNRNIAVIAVSVMVLFSFFLGFYYGQKTGTGKQEQKKTEPASSRRLLTVEPTTPGPAAPSPPPASGTAPSSPQSAPVKPEEKTHSASAGQKSPEPAPSKVPQSPQSAEVKDTQKSIADLKKMSREKEKTPEKPSDTGKVKQDKPAHEDMLKTAKTDRERVKPAQKEVSQKRSGSEEKKNTAEKKRKTPSPNAFTVQVGAFPEKKDAEKLKKLLQSRGYHAFIAESGGENLYYKVRVGRYTDRKGAEKAAVAVQQKTGVQYFVTRADR